MHCNFSNNLFFCITTTVVIFSSSICPAANGGFEEFRPDKEPVKGSYWTPVDPEGQLLFAERRGMYYFPISDNSQKQTFYPMEGWHYFISFLKQK